MPLGGSGHVIITSRNPRWSSVATTVEVDVFRREESQVLLTRRAPALTSEETDCLAEELGDLPLALEQAAAWMAESGMRVPEYLGLLREKRIELMEVSSAGDYRLPVTAAWNLSLDHLARENPSAMLVLQLCALFAPEPIPRSFLAAGEPISAAPELSAVLEDPIRLGNAIRHVHRYALARIDARADTIQLHRLVQAVLVERMTADERSVMRTVVHQLLAASDPRDPMDRTTWPRYAVLHPHLVASEATTTAADDRVRDLVVHVARYHHHRGNRQVSLEIAQRAHDSWRQILGEDAPQTLRIAHWLAYVLYSVGRYPDAARLNSRLLAVHEATAAKDLKGLLGTLQAIAADRRIEGKFRESLELSRDLHDRYIESYGRETR